MEALVDLVSQLHHRLHAGHHQVKIDALGAHVAVQAVQLGPLLEHAQQGLEIGVLDRQTEFGGGRCGGRRLDGSSAILRVSDHSKPYLAVDAQADGSLHDSTLLLKRAVELVPRLHLQSHSANATDLLQVVEVHVNATGEAVAHLVLQLQRRVVHDLADEFSILPLHRSEPFPPATR